MGDGPYRVGNHSPLNVWCETGQSTHEQVCMATSPRWAGRIVAALNEQDARSVGERAVSDAVASAHLSGVDLPADWVDTLDKVASGEVTADDAVQAVVESSLRDMIEAALCGGGEEQYDVHVTHAGIAETVMAVVAPMLAAKDRDVEQIRIRLAQTLNLPHSRTLDQLIDDVSEVFSGWVRMACEIGGLRRELKFTEATRQQYVEERDEALDDVERLRPALSKALADLVVRRQALANVLGVTDAGGVSGYYRMVQDVADLRAELGAIRARAQLAEDERDKANRQNESLARRLHLRFQNEQKLSAELGGARDLLGELELYVSWRYITGKLTTEQRELWADAVERWNPDPSDTPPPRQVDRWWRDGAPVGQPDTEATGSRHVDIDIRDHVVTGEAIAENPEWAHTAFVMATDVRTIIREWCAANGIPVDTEATEQAPAGSPAVTRAEWRDRYEEHYQASRDHGADRSNADIWAQDCTTNELGPEPDADDPLPAVIDRDPLVPIGPELVAKMLGAAIGQAPREPRAVYHDPGDLQYEYDEDDNPTDPSVGWDLTFGCRVSFSHDSDGYRATVSISDQTQRDGLAVRGVTRDQIRAYAYQLIRLTEVTEDGTQ